ncbi:MAG: tyrosine-type recombinase/integrase [Clostridia bacterium]|nr:tyrosine-type recombinase/integrase [Clostridia bacterium]
MSSLDLVNYFEEKLNNSRLGETTKSNYIADLNTFTEFVKKEKRRNVILDDLCLETLNEYLNFLKLQKNYATKSIRRSVSTFRKLCSYLKDDNFIESNPAYNIDLNIQYKNTKPEILTMNEIKFVLEYVRLKATERDSVIFSLLINTGIQVHELINLKKKNIILGKKAEEDTLLSVNNRVIPLPPKTTQDIKRYEQNNYINNYYFYGQRGKKTNSGIYRIILKDGHFTDIKITPRIFRNSFIDRLYKANASENVIRYLTGKEMNYFLDKPSYKEIKKAIYMVEL